MPKSQPFTLAELARIRAAWARDPHVERVAGILNIPSYRVRKAAKELRLPFPGPRENTGVADRQRNVLALYEKCGTLELAARELGVTTSAVQQTIKRLQRRFRNRYKLRGPIDRFEGETLRLAISECLTEGFTPYMISIALYTEADTVARIVTEIYGQSK